jgi:hypothetical protein
MTIAAMNPRRAARLAAEAAAVAIEQASWSCIRETANGRRHQETFYGDEAYGQALKRALYWAEGRAKAAWVRQGA